MKLLAPDYYLQFRCIAGRCRHSCCKGWEIDIDETSLKRFQSLQLPHISLENEPHFILKEGDRCPYLQEDGLCAMILEYGEEMLCNICRDHPRYRNFWTGFAEVGLGLSCEAAARLLLRQEKPLSLVVLGECDEEGVLLQKEGDDPLCGTPADPVLLTDEEDEQWLLSVRSQLLKEAASVEDPVKARLKEYLIFRHLADALYDGLLEERIAFIEAAYGELCSRLDRCPSEDEAARLEAVRSWSEYLEYNEERRQALLQSAAEGYTKRTE
ncbi:MAG: hypothetical protein HUJ80_04360 [Firmicutes bacterium]|nr:hypothetical protein [Bacillota bacterium]